MATNGIGQTSNTMLSHAAAGYWGRQMAPFELLMILVSVVIGLALSKVLMGAASLLRVRSTVRFYWLHVLLQLGVFFALFSAVVGKQGTCWARGTKFRHNPDDLVPLRHPAADRAHLVSRPAENADLEKYYYQQSPVLWLLVLVGTLQVTFVAPALRGDLSFEAADC